MHLRHFKRASDDLRRARADLLDSRQLGGGGPITLTVTVTHGPSSTTPAATLPATAAADSPVLLPPGSASADPQFSSVFSLVPQPTPTPPSSIASPPSPVASPTMPSLSSSSPPSVSKIPDLDGSAATANPVTLSSGAIVGIVIGCLVVLVVAVLVGLRKRTVRNRLKLRGVWAHSKTMGLRGSLRPTPYNYSQNQDSTLNGSMGFMGQPVSTKTTMNDGVVLNSPQPLPSAYGADFSPSIASSSPRIPVLFTTTVARSFVVSLPDELQISIGQLLKVLQVFDDGWAECMTFDGETGMVPTECFEKRSGDGERLSPKLSAGSIRGEEMARNSKRYSSLPGSRP